MRNKEIERMLNNAISNSVPDVLNNILERCENKKGMIKNVKVFEEENKRRIFTGPKLIGVFATVFVFALCIVGLGRYNSVYKVDSIIEFDVNPSIELEVNKKEEIIRVLPLNDDGKKVIEGMNLEDVDLDVAVNAIIGSMLKNGYITVDENSILISVKNSDTEKGNKLQQRLSKEIGEILSASSINGAVLTQSYDDNNEIESLAKENNISDGKAKLINEILNTGIKDSKGNIYTFEALSKLSINELNILLSSKETKVESVVSTGSASEKSYIGKEKAKQIAFNKAGVSSSKVYDLEVEFDCDDGKLVYEVDFNSGTKEYEYEIDAKSGSIIYSHVENDDDINDRDDDRYDD